MLKEKVRSGLIWAGGTRLVAQVLTWAVTIIVIRLLSPADYGLLAMAMVLVSFLSLIADAGLGAAIVQAPDLESANLRGIFAAVILVHCAMFVLVFLAAPAIADFFGEARLVGVLRIVGTQFLVGMFIVMPTALLTRALNFRHQSVTWLAGTACGSLCTLALAAHGWGVWSLVFGNLLMQVVNAILLNLGSPFLVWPDFSLNGVRSLAMFGRQVTAARILWFFYSQADIVIAGRLLGKEALGFYSVSMHIASLPVQKISGILNQVAFPAFARSQQDRELVSRYLLKAMRVLSLLSVPVLWGISSIAPEVVGVLLGTKWEHAVLPLQILPLVMPLTMLSPFINTAFQAIGRASVVLANVLTACLVMPIAFWIGAQYGLTGLAFAWLIAFPIVFALNLRRMLPQIKLRIVHVTRALAPAALAGVCMYGAVSLARAFASAHVEGPLLMAMLIAIGAATYLSLVWLTNRNVVHEIADLLGIARTDGVAKRHQD